MLKKQPLCPRAIFRITGGGKMNNLQKQIYFFLKNNLKGGLKDQNIRAPSSSVDAGHFDAIAAQVVVDVNFVVVDILVKASLCDVLNTRVERRIPGGAFFHALHDSF